MEEDEKRSGRRRKEEEEEKRRIRKEKRSVNNVKVTLCFRSNINLFTVAKILFWFF